jgi:phenylpropionate dioxygenase-like ring-hydroxylating dioxygenase large terminal subunit
MFIRNCWYVAAWDHEITAGSLLARTLLGKSIVFYRESSGRVVALENRCCHRFAPLSRGRLEGDHLRCMYHGLLFDSQGKCIEIPGQETIGPQMKVSSYPVVERDHYVWIWLGDADKADASKIVDCHWLDDPSWIGKPAYMSFAGNYLLLVDNLLDFSHLSYVHENTLGGSSVIAATRQKIEQILGGIRITRYYPSISMPPFARGIAPFEDPVDRWHIYNWYVAGNVLVMDSGWAPAGTGALEGRRAQEAMQFTLVQALTPESENATHYFWSQPRNFKLDDKALTETLATAATVAFVEDREMIEAQQKVIKANPDNKMITITADAALVRVRRMIDKALVVEAA